MKPRRAVLLCLLFAFGCAEEAPPQPANPEPANPAAVPRVRTRDPLKPKSTYEKYRKAGEADRVVILDILISFAGAKAKVKASRSKAEAQMLATEVLRKFTKERMDFLELAELYSDHRHPATGHLTVAYRLTNYGVKPKPVGEYAREVLHTGWGDVAFGLRVRGVVIAAHDMRASEVNDAPMLPDGWHVMYRVK